MLKRKTWIYSQAKHTVWSRSVRWATNRRENRFIATIETVLAPVVYRTYRTLSWAVEGRENALERPQSGVMAQAGLVL